jgi:hypothetical protein
MPFENEADAAEQLYAAVLEDGHARSDEQELHQEVQRVRESKADEVVGDEPGVTEQDTFSRIDPNSLPEELLPIYHSMQGDYTRKTQQVAQERKAFEQLEQYGGVDTALEAIQFANALATDPNYALQVRDQLTEALVQSGLTPAEASQVATQQVNEAASQSDDFAFGDDEYSNPEVKKLEQELAAMRQEIQTQADWRKQQEENAFNLQLANEMARQENAILTAHPEYDEHDLEKIYTLSYAYGGNLMEAEDVYRSIQNDVITDYINKKGQVPSGVSDIGGSGVVGVEEPTKFEGLYDKRMDALIRERLAQELAD